MGKLYLLLAVAFILTAPAFAQTKWEVDPAHSKVQFSISHMVISEVTGQFKSFSGDITTQGEDFSKAKIDFTIDVNSINTDNEKRDAHLKSPDFFDAKKYPYIKFKGNSLKKINGNKYKLTGSLTMKDVTKQVVLDVIHGGTVKGMGGKTVSGFKITGKLNRFDYNLKWNNLLETGGAVVGKDVDLLINLELIKQ